jgi:hypothetical protein
MMENNVNLRIILQNPPPGIQFALQQGKGSNYTSVQKQTSGTDDLLFEFGVKMTIAKTGDPDFAGPFVQGSRGERFVYISSGTLAGDVASVWTRRLKVPLTGLSPDLAGKLISNGNMLLETRVPGTGKDGGPNCASVKPFDGWYIADPHA